MAQSNGFVSSIYRRMVLDGRDPPPLLAGGGVGTDRSLDIESRKNMPLVVPIGEGPPLANKDYDLQISPMCL